MSEQVTIDYEVYISYKEKVANQGKEITHLKKLLKEAVPWVSDLHQMTGCFEMLEFLTKVEKVK